MKVLVVIDSLSFGGAENLVAAFARQAPRVGVELDVVSIAPPTTGRDAWLPVLESVGLRPRFLCISRLAQPDALLRVHAAIRRSRCDLVHAHLGTAATLAPVAARLAGRYAVCTFHHFAVPVEGREAAREWLALSAATRSRAAIFVSDAARRAFAGQYREDRRTWRVLYNGVDLEQFTPSDEGFPADLGLPLGSPVVTLVAAMRGGKGHAAAIEAWPLVLRAVPTAQLLLVGAGREEPELRRIVTGAGLAQHVRFAGLRADVPRLLAASTLAVLPTEREALPTVLIEAAACGVPAVATAVGGVPEVVRHGATGLLVPPGDVPGLAAAVVELLRDEPRRRQMGQAARRLAERSFDARAWAATLRRIYDRAAAGLPAGAAYPL